MAVAALSTAGFTQYIAASSNVSASDQAFQSLQKSLALGNLTAAQSAFNTYQQLNQSASTSPASQFSTDLTALGTAIGSGDLSTAQSAFATLQSDLKSSPSQSVSNAESAAAQTVQWVDDLLNLSTSSNAPTTPADPTSAILDAAYGLNPDSNSTVPTTSSLSNANDSPAAPAPASSGDNGSSASVNVYA
jgi:hypothetical protein